jgi:hypothetical protein
LFFISASQNKKTGTVEFPWPVAIIFCAWIEQTRGMPCEDQAGMGSAILKNKTTGHERTRGGRFQAEG